MKVVEQTLLLSYRQSGLTERQNIAYLAYTLTWGGQAMNKSVFIQMSEGWRDG